MQERSMSQQWSSQYLNMQVSYGATKNNKVFMDSIQVLQNNAAKMVLARAPHSSSTEALADLNWVNPTTRRQMKCCLYMYDLINSDNRNNMIIRGSDRDSHNTRSKDTVRIIKSETKW